MTKPKTYVGTGHGLYQLEHQDNVWNLHHLGLPGKNIMGLATKAKPHKLYAAIEGYGVYQAQLTLTQQSAPQWHQMLAVNAHSLLIDKVEGNQLWVGLEPPGIYYSQDGGLTWLDLSGGLLALPSALDWSFPRPPYQAQVCALLQPPDDVHSLVAGIAIGGVVRSSNNGQTWVSSDEGLDEEIQALAVHPQKPNFWLAATGDGLYVSEDGGWMWAEATELPTGYALTALISRAGVCLVAISNTPPGNWVENATTTLYRSSDLGQTWHVVELPALVYVTALGDAQAATGMIYAGTQDGAILISNDDGQTWQVVAHVTGAINLFLPVLA